jgi:hypothetical protein
MEIEGTTFGTITIDGKTYEHDVIIRLSGEVVKRKKKCRAAYPHDIPAKGRISRRPCYGLTCPRALKASPSSSTIPMHPTRRRPLLVQIEKIGSPVSESRVEIEKLMRQHKCEK